MTNSSPSTSVKSSPANTPIKGTIKEKVGDLTDNDELHAEGSAQQTKGEEETKETWERAKAQAHERKADALESERDALED